MVFAGEAMGLISAGRIRAPLHWVNEQVCAPGSQGAGAQGAGAYYLCHPTSDLPWTSS